MHSFFVAYFKCIPILPSIYSSSSYQCPMLSLVDMAGSERTNRTGNTDDKRMYEAGKINNSLGTLRECIKGLFVLDNYLKFEYHQFC